MTTERDHLARADQLDAYWDALAAGMRLSPYPASVDEEEQAMLAVVDRLQSIAPFATDQALVRMRQRTFGDAGPTTYQLPAPTAFSPNGNHRSPSRFEPLPPGGRGRLSRLVSFAAMAALLVVIAAGFLMANRDRGWFGSGPDESPGQALVSAQQAATPATDVPSEDQRQMSSAMPGGRRGVLWTLSSSGSPEGNHGAALIDGTLYRTTSSLDFTGIEAIDPDTGDHLWNRPIEWNGSSVSGDTEAVYIPVVDALVALDRDDGSEIWRTESDNQSVSVAAADGVVYMWDGLSTLTAQDASNAEVLWVANPSEPAPSTSSGNVAKPVIAGTAVVVATDIGDLIAFDRTTGQQRWLAGGFASSDVEIRVADNGTLVATGLQGQADGGASAPNFALLLAIDPTNGTVLWYKQPTSIHPSVHVSGSMVMLLADIPFRSPETVTIVEGDGTQTEVAEGDRSGLPLRVYGFDLATGDPIVEWTDDREAFNATGHSWVSNQGDPGFSALAPLEADGELVLATSDAGRLTSLNSANAQFTGIVDLGQPLAQAPFGDAEGELALLASGDLVRIDVGVLNGTSGILATRSDDPDSIVDWTLPMSMQNGQFASLGAMTAANSMVYRTIETDQGRFIQAVYGPTGQQAWESRVDWEDRGLFANAAGVYFVDDENQVVMLDAFTGEQRWSIPFEDREIVSVAQGNRLYVWDESGTMTALDMGEGGIAWERQTGIAGPQTSDLGKPVPIVVGNLVVMVAADGTVVAIDQETGNVEWTQTGFDGANTRFAWQDGTLFVLSSSAEGLLTGSGLDLTTGEVRWTIALDGQLYQPVATNENFFYVIGDEVTQISALDAAFDPIEDFSGGPYQTWIGSKASLEEPYVGGRKLFGINSETGEIIWSRSSMAGGFFQLQTGCPNSCGLSALTSDGQLVSLARDNGAISGDPSLYPYEFGRAPIALIDGGFGETGNFATLDDGTLINYGATPFNRMG